VGGLVVVRSAARQIGFVAVGTMFVLAGLGWLSAGDVANAGSSPDGHCPPGRLSAPGLQHAPGLDRAPGLAGNARGPRSDPDCGTPTTTTTSSPPPSPTTTAPPATTTTTAQSAATLPTVTTTTSTTAPLAMTTTPPRAPSHQSPPEPPAGDSGEPQAAPRPEPTIPARPDGSDRSFLAAAIPTLSDISFEPGHVAANGGIVLLLLLLTGLPAEVLNATLKENYDQRLRRSRFSRLVALGSAINALPNPVLLVGFGLVGALIHGQLDPHLGLNRQSLILVAGLAAALVVVTGLAEALRMPYLRRRGGPPSHLRMFPLALVAAVSLVGVSRAFGLQPGLIFGITCGLALAGEISEIEEGRSIAVAAVGLLVVAIASWLVWTPVADAAAGPDPGTGTLFLDAALSALWVTGLQAVIFGLLPLRFLYGEKLMKWSPLCWIAIYGAALFLFVHAVARPGGGSEGHVSSSATIWSMFGVLGLFTLGSLGVWAWFRYVAPARRVPDLAET
jgi:hypothetical protein